MATLPTTEHLSVQDAQIELARLATKSEMTPEEYFKVFLQLTSDVVLADQAVIWGLTPRGQLAKVADFTGLDSADDEVQESNFQKGEALYKVVQTNKFNVVPAATKSGQKIKVLAPLELQGKCVGIADYLIDRSFDPKTAQRFLAELLVYANDFLATQQQQQAQKNANTSGNSDVTGKPNSASEQKMEEFLLELHREDSTQFIASTTVNDGRLVIGCDRAAICLQNGSQSVVKAISGQSEINHRSNLIRSVSELADQVMVSGERLTYSGKLDGVPPQVEQCLIQYVSESGSTSLEVIPLFQPQPKSDSQSKQKKPVVIGALVTEYLSEQSAKPNFEVAEKVATHVSHAIHHSLAHERVFLLPARRLVGKLLNMPEKSTKQKYMWALMTLTFAIFALALIPYPYRVEAEGKLVPMEQSRVFAPHNGEVIELLVHGGQHVKKGQTLLKLHNDQLTMRRIHMQNEFSEQQQVLLALQAERDQFAGASREEQIRLQGRIAKTFTEVEGLKQRLAAIDRELAKSTVTAQFDGTVATFDLEKLLRGRPVERGQILMEIMKEDGDWQLELEVPGYRMGHIQNQQKAKKTIEIPVSFVLQTMPEKTFDATLHEMSTRTLEREDGSVVVKVHAKVNDAMIEGRTVEAEVMSRIECGNSTLFYVIFGDVIESMKRTFW